MNKINATHTIPSVCLVTDETLYPYRGCIGIKLYNPSKPAKCGLFYSLPNAVNPNPTNDATSKYYAMGTNNYAEWLLNEASKYNKFKGCNISMAMCFASVIVARLGMEKRYAIVGTID